MKRNPASPARHVDPILKDLYAVKASLNRKAKFDLKVLCAQVRKEAQRRKGSPSKAAGLAQPAG